MIFYIAKVLTVYSTLSLFPGIPKAILPKTHWKMGLWNSQVANHTKPLKRGTYRKIVERKPLRELRLAFRSEIVFSR